MVGAYGLLGTPDWYRPPVIAAADRQRMRNLLVEAEQAFTEHLLAGGRFDYHMYADYLNGWIAMRQAIFPLIDEVMPTVFRDPLVVFADGRITLSGSYQLVGVNAIVSIDLRPIVEEDAVVLKAEAVRCGRLQIPKGLRWMNLNGRAEYAAEELWPGSPAVTGDLETGLRIDARAWWKNGGVHYRVRDVSVHPGELRLSIEPLGRHQDRARRRQLSFDDPVRSNR